ncbi:FHA domain-containing serine/threonine-protein kinase [Candidatus Methanodesulfokora washburnensis]|jgi:serine/threonine protein kinase|uniref:FHA domain-containing protein n=1 Tax=Candidatus Methanodesulfokora washburnensis TaxID=2478471 RepID=A0A429GI78_9CREN|nr:protein kinase [Candidatus Methanodesulfokores washburnensis]RSN73475.1 FHA domain-containing protein [Candidatus Methanodesulfokores washburnensis]
MGRGGLPFDVGDIVLGKYRLTKFIHMGGMGVVFKAMEITSGSIVVAKFARLNGHPDIRPLLNKNKLETEAAILEDIWKKYGGHPYIVKFIERGLEGDHPVLIIEFIDGESLINFARKQGGLDADLAFDIGFKLAEVLDFLHSKNILHRDFGPDNIMIRRRNNDPVLIDFGTSKYGYIQSHTIISGKDIHPPELKMKGEARPSTDVYMWAATVMKIMKPYADDFSKYLESSTFKLIYPPCRLVDCRTLTRIDRRKFDDILIKCLDPDHSKRITSGHELLSMLKGISIPPVVHNYIIVNGRRIDLDPNKKYVIGREGSGANIEVVDPQKHISRKHAELWFDRRRGKWIVSDRHSTNGTLVIKSDGPHLVCSGNRGKPVSPPVYPVELDPGDKIVLAFKDKGGNMYDPYIEIPFY